MRSLQTTLLLGSLVLAPACSQSGITSPPGSGDDGGGVSDASLAHDSGQAAGDSGGADGTGSLGGDSSGPDGTAASGGDSGQSDGAPRAGDAGGDASQTCSGLPLCDDFESYTVGSAPGAVGGGWTLIGTKGCSGVGNPSAPTIYPIVVDDTQFHSGTKSAKVMGGDSCGPLMLNASAFSKLSGGEVFGRFYALLSDTSMTFDHTAFMTLGLAADAGTSLNVGDQTSYLQLASEGAGNPTNILMWQTSDSNVLPDKNTMGGAQSTYPMGTAWTCIEFHTSATSGAIEAWVNGAAIAGLTFIPSVTTKISSVNDQWKAPSPFVPTSIGFGWILFSGPTMTLWIDDVAVASSRIGCQ